MRQERAGLVQKNSRPFVGFVGEIGQKIGVERLRCLRQRVRVKATIKGRAKSEGAVLDHATSNLLRALKRDMLKKEGRVDPEKLRKDGYSDRLIAKLEQA